MGNRLKELRAARGWTHEIAAENMGVSRSQFIKLERGERKLTLNYIEQAARAFGVTAAEIIQRQTQVPVMGYVGAGAQIEPEFEQVPEHGLFTVEVPFDLPDDMIGLEVRGDSMFPRYYEGEIIIVYREIVMPLKALIGVEAAVRTDDGRRYVKTIERNSTPGLVNLTSFNARPMLDMRLEWWSEVYVRVQARQVRKVSQRV